MTVAPKVKRKRPKPGPRKVLEVKPIVRPARQLLAFRLPSALIAEIDRDAVATGRTRTNIIEDVLRQAYPHVHYNVVLTKRSDDDLFSS